MTSFLSRFFIASFVAVILSCGPAANDKREADTVRVWELDARTLHNSYRDRSERWTGQTLRVVLTLGSYSVSGREVHWNGDDPKDPPDIVFECPSFPSGPGAVEIVAVCVGRVEDGKARSTGLKFHVRLRATSVAALK